MANNFVNDKSHEQSRTISTLLSVGFLFPHSSSKYCVFTILKHCRVVTRTPSTLLSVDFFFPCHASKYRSFIRFCIKFGAEISLVVAIERLILSDAIHRILTYTKYAATPVDFSFALYISILRFLCFLRQVRGVLIQALTLSKCNQQASETDNDSVAHWLM